MFEFILPGGLISVSVLSTLKFFIFLKRRKFLKGLGYAVNKFNKRTVKELIKLEKISVKVIQNKVARLVKELLKEKDFVVIVSSLVKKIDETIASFTTLDS